MCVRMFFGKSGDNIPIILEEGNIKVIDLNNAMKVEGTPLNDKFYAFMTERDSLLFLLQELPRKESTMILDGYDHDDILRQLGEEEGTLRIAIDKLETDFVTANVDNVLGLTYFLVLCDNAYNQFGFPTTTPQIDEIYGRAPETFKELPRFFLSVHADEELFVVLRAFDLFHHEVHGFHWRHVGDMVTQHPHAVERGLVLQQVVATRRTLYQVDSREYSLVGQHTVELQF